jgi:hypothetical protein
VAARGGAAHVARSKELEARAARERRLRGAPCRAATLRSAAPSRTLASCLDPPPLARRKADVERASRAYKDLLLHAFAGAHAGRLVLAFACSHHVGPALFQKIAFGAALDAGRRVALLRELGAPSDHPVSLDHPEAAISAACCCGGRVSDTTAR